MVTGLTFFQACVLVVSIVTLLMIWQTYTKMQECEVALEYIGDLETCRACDVLEGAGVIVKK